MTHLYAEETEKTSMFSESCNSVSLQWSHSVSGGSLKIRHRPPNSPVDLDRSRLISHWKDGTFTL